MIFCRGDGADSSQQIGAAVSASLAPAPTAADSLSASFVRAPSDPHQQSDWLQSLLKQMTQGTLVRSEYPTRIVAFAEHRSLTLARTTDALTLVSAAVQGIEAKVEGGLDDRKLLLEHIIVMLQSLPPVSRCGGGTRSAKAPRSGAPDCKSYV